MCYFPTLWASKLWWSFVRLWALKMCLIYLVITWIWEVDPIFPGWSPQAVSDSWEASVSHFLQVSSDVLLGFKSNPSGQSDMCVPKPLGFVSFVQWSLDFGSLVFDHVLWTVGHVCAAVSLFCLPQANSHRVLNLFQGFDKRLISLLWTNLEGRRRFKMLQMSFFIYF